MMAPCAGMVGMERMTYVFEQIGGEIDGIEGLLGEDVGEGEEVGRALVADVVEGQHHLLRVEEGQLAVG